MNSCVSNKLRRIDFYPCMRGVQVFIAWLMVCSFFISSKFAHAEPQPLPTRLTVDISALKKDAVAKETLDAIHERIVTQGISVLEQKGLSIVDQEEEAAIVAKLQWRNAKRFEYVVQIDLVYQQQPVEPGSEPVVCSGCSADMIIQTVVDQFPEAAHRLHEAREKANTTSEPTQTKCASSISETPPACQNTDTPTPPDPRKYRRFFIAGGVVTGAGVGLIVAGATLLAKDDTHTRDLNDHRFIQRRNFDPGGIALTSIGATMAVTGVAILVTTHLRRKKEFPKKLSAYPFFHQQALGMGISARF